MMNCKEAIPMIHEYLDGDLQGSGFVELNKHLSACRECKRHFAQLEQAESLVFTMAKTKVSDGLTERIMLSLPQPKKKAWLQWVKRHPAASVAATFFLIMMSSFFSLWNQDTDLVVKGADLEQVIIKGDTVIVPAGRIMNGNLIVENGRLQVDGEVQGNLVVIDGSLNLASTAYISGEVTKVNQALDWLWYKVNEFFSLFMK